MATQWNESQIFRLRSDKVTSLNLQGGYTTIQLCSDIIEEYGGFDLDFYAILLNGNGLHVPIREEVVTKKYFSYQGIGSWNIINNLCIG